MLKNLFFALLSTFLFISSAQSQVTSEQQDVQATPIAREEENKRLQLELSIGSQNLSNGYGDWKDLTIRSSYKIKRHELKSELSQSRRFDQDGLFVGASDTYTINDDWYGSFALGVGDGSFYLPRYRVDGTIYRKMLADRNLVVSVGAGYYRAPDSHTDSSLSVGLIYYFMSPWVLEAGVRFNNSKPGAVITRQQFLAVTYGRDKQDLFVARYGWGAEGYLAIAANNQIVDFKSNETSLTWRHWINSTTGMLISATNYNNPSYRRTGMNIGVFTSY